MSDVPAIRIENHNVTTRDNTPLSATLFRPHDHNNHTVLIANAMGMPQRFYRHYASYLAEQGCVVMTFDYRGIAQSKTSKNLWGYNATLEQWASQDLQAVIKWLTRQYPSTELTVIGHSLGGHLLGATSDNKYVSSLIGVSAQNTYWRNWAWWRQPIMGLFWFVVLPILTYAIGCFPSRVFGLGEPLPKQIALDWARGARNKLGNKGLFVGTTNDHYADFTGYTRFYSFSDDATMAPRKSVEAILAYYPNAKHQQHRHVSPQMIGIDSIGHIRFFRPEMRDTLWHESFVWLMNPSSASELVNSSENSPTNLQASSLPQASL